MEQEYILITDFCMSHNIETHFVTELYEYGLVDIVVKEDVQYIPIQQLPKAEKILRLHADLDINLEGIAVITQLLNQMEKMQDEITQLKNKLDLFI
ncbi:chaperone modulator CbpM [Arenibacter sp. M-2]|uniref:chaperone modulator CbpM n=1 Tax=unclassified Arenibacter TaxID=2615047 RepID=UPI000D75A0BD|nr:MULTISPECIES: chaperone modulator CbpM [unclassified Arenibacter]MDL5512346.1 chaperone modulator CbpM [Arenibacter sp. M-2]PXX26438.1 MerR-like DNA binding protein [Arenibacter sp. ARW7G5Y1]